MRTAVVLLLEESAPAIAAARAELDPELALHIPLHITLLVPFVPREELLDVVVDELAAFLGDRTAPSFELARVEEFPGVVTYAAPEPASGLGGLMAALWAQYPDLLPYGGGVSEPVPHATLTRLGVEGAASVDDVRARVEPLLPVACELAAATLVEEVEPDRWRGFEQLPFAARAASALERSK